MKYVFIKILTFFVILTACNSNKKQENNTNNSFFSIQGQTQGTFYNIKYKYNRNLKTEIDSVLNEFENSMSTFRDNSIISRVNKNDTSVVVDKFFIQCFEKAQKISETTNGAFDMTVAPLVNLWGFGFENKNDTNESVIDSILNFVGYKKVILSGNKIIKSDNRIMLDASAIAKGQSVDVVAEYLKSLGIDDFLVEIGGEVRTEGVKQNNSKWVVGIDKPIDNSGYGDRELQAKISISGKSVATSGNYRKFYIKNGKRYSHTISPFTGYPVEHNLLSATVIASDCITADAYATAFMVLGLQESKIIAEKDAAIEAFFIFSEDKKIKTEYTKGLENYFVK